MTDSENHLKLINDEMDKINQRLGNNNFVEKAPVELIDQEKTNFNNLKKDGKIIAGYGAATKSTIIINYCKFTIQEIQCS